MGEVVQDVTEDDVSPAIVGLSSPCSFAHKSIHKHDTFAALRQAAAAWAHADLRLSQPEQAEIPADFELASQEMAEGNDQQSTDEYEGQAFGMPQADEQQSTEEQPTEQTATQLEDDVSTAHQLEQEEEPEDAREDMAAPAAQPADPQAEVSVADIPSQGDKAAATLSKELRKLQAESAVLQEHSRRLQEKAALMQQQRMSADQVTVVGCIYCTYAAGHGMLACLGS